MAGRRRSSSFLGGRRQRSASDKLAAQGVALLAAVGFVAYVVREFWPILVVVAGVSIAWVIHQRSEREKRIRALSLAEIDFMNGTEFEHYLAKTGVASHRERRTRP